MCGLCLRIASTPSGSVPLASLSARASVALSSTRPATRCLAEEMRRLWLLEEVRSRRLGFGKAAELAGVPVAAFLRLMGEHHVTAFDYDDSELDRELGKIS